MALVPLSNKTKGMAPGLRVQTADGEIGTIRWVGRLERSDKPPNGENGHYVGVEFDNSSKNKLRCNGTYSGNGKSYFKCDSGKGEFMKPRYLFKESNTEGIRYLRQHFGKRVEHWHDFELVKFCIARKFDMEKVKAMLEKHLQWADEFKPSADEYFPDGMEADYPCGYSGKTDCDGNLVYCERPGNAGKCPPAEFVRKYQIPTIARWHACSMEMGKRLMRQSNYQNKRVCYFVDLTNLGSTGRPLIQFAQTLATVEQDNYPEHLGRLFIINAPGFFQLAWRLIKVFIDERTKRKINFLSKENTVNTIREYLPVEDIPDFAGGPSNEWMRNNGRIGSTDPTKVYTGKVYIPEGQTEEDLKKLEEAAGSEALNESDTLEDSGLAEDERHSSCEETPTSGA